MGHPAKRVARAATNRRLSGMSIEKILLDEAARMADSLEGCVATLELELVAVEQRRLETEAELKAARLARTRLLDFRPRRGHGYQCPHCWIQNQTQSTLSPVASVTSDEILRCDACGSEYVIPVAVP
jgi:hypothetical protein